MKALKIIVGIVLVLCAVFFFGAYLLPDRMTVERHVEIERPAALVYAIANDLSRFNDWSPWYPLDSEATYRFDGPAAGAGATMHWQGNDAVGAGTMRIVSSEPPTQVNLEVAFEGFAEPADSAYLIESTSETASRMTWTFDSGLSGPTARWLGLVMPGYIGADYEKGLAQLKALLEAMPVQVFADLDVTEEATPALDAIVVAGSAPRGDMIAISAVLGELYGQLIAFAGENGIEIVGQPLTFTDDLDGDVWRFEAALPVRDGGAIRALSPIAVKRIPAADALVVEHIGHYDQLPAAMDALDAYAAAYGHVRTGPIQQVYVSDPGDTPPESLVTRIVFPITIERAQQP